MSIVITSTSTTPAKGRKGRKANTATAPAALLANTAPAQAAPAAPVAPAAPRTLRLTSRAKSPKGPRILPAQAAPAAPAPAAQPAKVRKPRTLAPVILPFGKGSPERLAAGAKAAATRARNLAALGIVPRAKGPKLPTDRKRAAHKAWRTMYAQMLPGSKGRVRKAIQAKIAHYDSLLGE